MSTRFWSLLRKYPVAPIYVRWPRIWVGFWGRVRIWVAWCGQKWINIYLKTQMF